MGAIAVSVEDERRILRIGKRLGVRSKAGVVHVAVEELEHRLERQERADAIRAYVRKYGHLDRQENALLSAGGVARDDS